MTTDSANAWIEHEDRNCRQDRIARLQWLAGNYPASHHRVLLHGGLVSQQLLEEAKYCFAYGQYLATAVLGVAFVEHTLAAQFYASGRNDLERVGGKSLLGEARQSGWITESEYYELDRIRQLRNPLVHFRRPLHPTTIEHRVVQQNREPEQILEDDARRVLSAAFRILAKAAV